VPKERTREPNKKGQVRKLSDYLKATGQSPVTGNDREDRVDEESSNIGYASDQRFKEAHRKTSILHAGLFR